MGQLNLLESFVGIFGDQELTEQNLIPHIPYYYVEDNIVYLEDGTVTIVLKIEPIYDDRLDEAQYKTIHNNLVNLLNNLDQECIIQTKVKKFGNLTDIIQKHKDINTSNDPAICSLYDKRGEKLNADVQKYRLFNFDNYYCLSKKYTPLELEATKAFVSDSEEIADSWAKKIKKMQAEMTELSQKTISGLRSAGIVAFAPTEQETIDYLASSINLIEMQNVKFKYKSDFVSSCLMKNDFYLAMNEKYAKVISIKENRYPKKISFSIIKLLYSNKINFDLEVQLTFKRKNTQSVNNLLESQRGIANALSTATPSGIPIAKLAVEEAKLTNILNDIAHNDVGIFDMELMILVKGSSRAELKSNCNLILSQLNQMGGATGFVESEANLELFKTFWPGVNTLDNQRTFTVRSQVVAQLMPIFGPPTNNPKTTNPVILFYNRWGGLSYIDPLGKEKSLRNMIIAGTSGQGKTNLVEYFCECYAGTNTEFIFLEPADSYGKLVKQLGGEFWDVDSSVSINPFNISIYDETLSENVNLNNKRMLWRTVLSIMVRDPEKPVLNRDQLIVLNQTIETVLQSGNSVKTVYDFINAMIANKKTEDSDLKVIYSKYIRYLDEWTKGIYGEFICGESNKILDVTNRVIGFNLKPIEQTPELMELFITFASQIIWSRLLQRKDKTLQVVMDEVWRLFDTQAGTKLGEELFRTIRKYKGAATLVSQDVGTYYHNKKLADAIMGNLAGYCLLKMEKGSQYEELQKVFSLTDREMEMIHSIEFKKGYFAEAFVSCKDDLPGFIGRVEHHPYSYWLKTTDPDDRLLYNAVLEKLAAEYPNGAFKN